MRITVVAVEENEAVLVSGTSAFGIRGKFGCPLVAGEVIFIAARGFEDNLRAGGSITVETDYESLSDVSVLPDGDVQTMEPAAQAGDYVVRGRVLSAVDGGIVRVGVRGFVFDLDCRDIAPLTVEVGQGLRFTVHRLVFWDCNT